jgi:hypothetical protein
LRSSRLDRRLLIALACRKANRKTKNGNPGKGGS